MVEVGRAALEVRLALLRYREERGAYPENLQMLFPDYLQAVPLDPFTGLAPPYLPAEGLPLYRYNPRVVPNFVLR